MTVTGIPIAAREKALSDLRRALVERLNVKHPVDEIDPDVALFGSGYGLDSLDAVELVVFLETHFGIKSSDGPPLQMRAAMRTLNTLTDLIFQFKPELAHVA